MIYSKPWPILLRFLRSWNLSQICGSQQWRFGDPSLHHFDTVAEYDGQTDRATNTHSKTHALTTAKMREALHTVAREKSCAILNFARFDSLVCIVACSREKSRWLPLALALAYRPRPWNDATETHMAFYAIGFKINDFRWPWMAALHSTAQMMHKPISEVTTEIWKNKI